MKLPASLIRFTCKLSPALLLFIPFIRNFQVRRTIFLTTIILPIQIIVPFSVETLQLYYYLLHIILQHGHLPFFFSRSKRLVCPVFSWLFSSFCLFLSSSFYVYFCVLLNEILYFPLYFYAATIHCCLFFLDLKSSVLITVMFCLIPELCTCLYCEVPIYCDPVFWLSFFFDTECFQLRFNLFQVRKLIWHWGMIQW